MATGVERELTHDELWDDSALVESWNEALEEYKKYHSMAARGEKVPEVRAPEVTTQPQQTKVLSKAEVMLRNQPPSQAREEASDEEEAEEYEDSGLPNPKTNLPGNFIGPIPPPKPSNAVAASSSNPAGLVSNLAVPENLAGMPQAMLGAIQDENLKNMMMSWYYAGYHMGLYEGQQKAWAEMQQAQEGAHQDGSAG